MVNRSKCSFAVALLAMMFTTPLWADDARWQELREVYFGDREIIESDRIGRTPTAFDCGHESVTACGYFQLYRRGRCVECSGDSYTYQ